MYNPGGLLGDQGCPIPKAHGILFLYGITADEAQLAIFDSRSVLQEQDEYPSAKYGTFPATKRQDLPRTPHLKLTSWGR